MKILVLCVTMLIGQAFAVEKVCTWHGTCVGQNNSGQQHVSGECKCKTNSVTCAVAPAVPSPPCVAGSPLILYQPKSNKK